MAEAHVIRALQDKQAELATGIDRLEQQIVEYRAGLAHLEGVMRLFDPSVLPEAVHPGRQTAQRMWFRPGEPLRLIYDVLREAPHPMATRDVAERVMAAKGIAMADDHSRVLIQKTIHPSLSGSVANFAGRHRRLLRNLTSPQVLVLDDWGLAPLDAPARQDVLEILEDRYGRRSTIVTSQVPVDHWHQLIGDPTYADAILDRLVHNTTRIDLTGESLRKKRATSTQNA